MSTESFWHFHIGKSVPIWFEAREPDPDNPGKYRAMDLGGGSVELLLTGPRNAFEIRKAGTVMDPETQGKGLVMLNPADTEGVIDPAALPMFASFKLTAIRADGYVGVQNRGRVTIYP